MLVGSGIGYANIVSHELQILHYRHDIGSFTGYGSWMETYEDQVDDRSAGVW